MVSCFHHSADAQKYVIYTCSKKKKRKKEKKKKVERKENREKALLLPWDNYAGFLGINE